jgi:hypothetical protein
MICLGAAVGGRELLGVLQKETCKSGQDENQLKMLKARVGGLSVMSRA